MTASMLNTTRGTPFGVGVDDYVNPQFIGYAKRAPTINDIYNPGTRWQDNSVNPPEIYETTGAGIWLSDSSEGDFTELTVVGPTDLTGITNINTVGSAVTNIGTGGTGAVNIGNATGQVTATGTMTTEGSLRAEGGVTLVSGNMLISSSNIKFNAQVGSTFGVSAPLVAGSLVVNVTGVTANSIIFFSTNTLGTVTVPQSYVATAKGAGTFTILSSDATDTSTVNYFIVN